MARQEKHDPAICYKGGRLLVLYGSSLAWQKQRVWALSSAWPWKAGLPSPVQVHQQAPQLRGSPVGGAGRGAVRAGQVVGANQNHNHPRRPLPRQLPVAQPPQQPLYGVACGEHVQGLGFRVHTAGLCCRLMMPSAPLTEPFLQ